jgi:hypothetical protein
MLGDLFGLFPRPVVLGDAPEIHDAYPLRVRDALALEAWAGALYEHPADTLPPPDAPDAPEVRAVVRAAWDAFEADPDAPGWGSTWCNLLVFATAVGRARYLAAVLRWEPDRLADAQALEATVTPDQWPAVARVAFGRDGAEEIVAAADRLAGAQPPAPAGVRQSWRTTLAEACAAAGCVPAAGLETPLAAVAAIRAGGKAPDPWGNPDMETLLKREAFWEPAPEATEGRGDV